MGVVLCFTDGNSRKCLSGSKEKGFKESLGLILHLFCVTCDNAFFLCKKVLGRGCLRQRRAVGSWPSELCYNWLTSWEHVPCPVRCACGRHPLITCASPGHLISISFVALTLNDTCFLQAVIKGNKECWRIKYFVFFFIST